MSQLPKPTRRSLLSTLTGAAASAPLIAAAGMPAQAQIPVEGPAQIPAQIPAQTVQPARHDIVRALSRQGHLTEGRRLSHLSHVCDLFVDGATLHVVDMREIVPGAMTPRGHNRVVLFDGALSVVQEIEYGGARPLFGDRHELHFFGDVVAPGTGGEGNVLAFGDGGRTVTARFVEPNDQPAPAIGASAPPEIQ